MPIQLLMDVINQPQSDLNIGMTAFRNQCRQSGIDWKSLSDNVNMYIALHKYFAVKYLGLV